MNNPIFRLLHAPLVKLMKMRMLVLMILKKKTEVRAHLHLPLKIQTHRATSILFWIQNLKMIDRNHSKLMTA